MDNAGGSNVITKFSKGKEGGRRHQTNGSVRRAEFDIAGSEGTLSQEVENFSFRASRSHAAQPTLWCRPSEIHFRLEPQELNFYYLSP